MNKLVRIIETMDKEDLKKIQLDMNEGNLKRLVRRRLGELDDDNKVCPICNQKITSQDFKLEFGRLGMRMRASFDGLDCLKNFVGKMK